MANLPAVNRTAVTRAPIHTSCQVRSTEGRILKIMAKSSTAMAKATRLLRVRRMTLAPEKLASR
jgi:hypothetical protein